MAPVLPGPFSCANAYHTLMSIFTPRLIGLLVFVLVILIAYAFNVRKSSINAKFDSLENSEGMTKYLAQLGQETVKVLPDSFVRTKKVRDGTTAARLNRAGDPWGLDPISFNVLKIGCAVICVLMGSVLGVFLKDTVTFIPWIVWPIVLGILGYMIPEYDLRKREKDRMMAFRKQLPNALDFLRLETESSNSMPQSFQKITPYLERGVVKDEFNNVCKDMDAGRPFADALRGLAERSPSPDIESFVNVLIQSGNGSDNSIKDALERRAKASRQEYISILNNRIASVEPKIAAMLLPTMVGALVLVAVGPSISTIMNMLGAAI